MALSKPVLTIQLGLTAGFNDAVGTVAWTDITPYVLPWGTNRGRGVQKPPAHFEPGQANLTLNNRDRRFDPTNTAGPYYPNLKPAKVRLRIRATWDAGAGPVTYDVFTGYVKRWPPEWTASATSLTKITAVDALGAPLNLAQIAGSIWQTMVRHDEPLAWYRMGESLSSTTTTVAVDATAHRHDGQYQGTPELGKDSLVYNDQGDKAARFPAGSRLSIPDKTLIPGFPFTVECWFRCGASVPGQRVILAAYDGAAAPIRQILDFFVDAFTTPGMIWARLSNPAGTGTRTEVRTSVAVNDGAVHHLVWVAESNTVFKLYLDGADVTVVVNATANLFPNDLLTGYAIGNTPAVAFGDFCFGIEANDVLDEVVIYDHALSAARILKHYQASVTAVLLAMDYSGNRVHRLLDEVDWPSADRDIDTGESQLQMLTTAGGLVANLQKVEDSEQGALFVDETGKVVFHSRHAILAAPYTTSQVTLGQGVGDQPYEAPVLWGNDDAELFNAASGSRVGGPVYTVKDEASQAEYGERPLGSMDGLLNISDAEVVDLLTYRVSKYAQPSPSVRQVRLHPAAVPALYPYVLGLGLRSRITVKVAPPGGGPVFSQESHIERISHDVDDKGDWWTVWDISAADVSTFWTLDHATLGLLDSGNVLAL